MDSPTKEWTDYEAAQATAQLAYDAAVKPVVEAEFEVERAARVVRDAIIEMARRDFLAVCQPAYDATQAAQEAARRVYDDAVQPFALAYAARAAEMEA